MAEVAHFELGQAGVGADHAGLDLAADQEQRRRRQVGRQPGCAGLRPALHSEPAFREQLEGKGNGDDE